MPLTIFMRSLKLKKRKPKKTLIEKGRALTKWITIHATGEPRLCFALLTGDKQRKGDVWEDGYAIKEQMVGQRQGDRSIQFQVWRPMPRKGAK